MTASIPEWIEGARIRTLPAAISPVAAGTGAACAIDAAVWWKALLALALSLAMQIGVNFANDYSDGIRGTDADRVGPLRLVGSGRAQPHTVKYAAFGCFAIGAACGFALSATSSWWLLLVGALAIVAAWTYTGGPLPYGYYALGEVSVFVFFGLVAVLGTMFVQAEELTATSWIAAIGIGALACAILVANNLRDIPTDQATGKRTLAVLLSDTGSRFLFCALLVGSAVAVGAIAILEGPWPLLGFAALPLGLRAFMRVARGDTGTALVPVLRDIGLAELIWALGVSIGLAL